MSVHSSLSVLTLRLLVLVCHGARSGLAVAVTS